MESASLQYRLLIVDYTKRIARWDSFMSTWNVANPAAPDVSESVRVLVDTGATLSVLPADLLDSLGVRRRYRRRLQGFGGVVTRDTGTVNMSYEDSEEGVTVVFGNEDDPPIMGVTALETLGFEVDPVNGRLNRVDMLVM